jgi:hypothetical protein
MHENPFATAVKAREETNFPGSVRTARRRIKQAGLKNSAAARKPFLTEENKRHRVEFATNFLNENEEFWTSVVFTDEKTFQSCYNGRLRVYRPRNSRFHERYIHQVTNSGRFSVNVWGWISVHGPGICWRIDGRFTAVHYRDISENIMLPSVQQIFPNNFVFQQVVKLMSFLLV